jgi:hypothetical protein
MFHEGCGIDVPAGPFRNSGWPAALPILRDHTPISNESRHCGCDLATHSRVRMTFAMVVYGDLHAGELVTCYWRIGVRLQNLAFHKSNHER